MLLAIEYHKIKPFHWLGIRKNWHNIRVICSFVSCLVRLCLHIGRKRNSASAFPLLYMVLRIIPSFWRENPPYAIYNMRDTCQPSLSLPWLRSRMLSSPQTPDIAGLAALRLKWESPGEPCHDYRYFLKLSQDGTMLASSSSKRTK
jgi:hypothetical protein